MNRDKWLNVRLGDVVQQIKDQVDAFSCGLDYYLGGEHFNTDDLHVNGSGEIAGSTIGPAFTMRFMPGDVLLVSRNPHLRKAAVADFKGVCSNVTYVLRVKDKRILQEYLPFVVRSSGFWNFAMQNKRGSTNFYLNWSDFEKYQFKLPPIDTQKRIAKLLWAAEKSLEAHRCVLKNETEFLQIALEHTFKSLGYAHTVSFADVGEWRSGGTPSRKIVEYWNGDIPWVSPKDMKSEYIDSSIEKISEKAVNDGVSGAKLLPSNTILFVVRGMILAHTFPIAITGLPVAINQDIKAVMVSSEFNVKYVYYWLQYQVPFILTSTEESSHGTKRLATEVLGALQIPKIPIAQQCDIILKFDTISTAISNSKKHIEQTQKLITSLCNQYVGGDSNV